MNYRICSDLFRHFWVSRGFPLTFEYLASKNLWSHFMQQDDYVLNSTDMGMTSSPVKLQLSLCNLYLVVLQWECPKRPMSRLSQTKSILQIQAFQKAAHSDSGEGHFAWSLRLKRHAECEWALLEAMAHSLSIQDTLGLICKHNLNQVFQKHAVYLPIILFVNGAI